MDGLIFTFGTLSKTANPPGKEQSRRAKAKKEAEKARKDAARSTATVMTQSQYQTGGEHRTSDRPRSESPLFVRDSPEETHVSNSSGRFPVLLYQHHNGLELRQHWLNPVTGVSREIWQPGDGDGDHMSDYNGCPRPTKRYRLYQSDVGNIVRHKNEPPKNVMLDDKAAYEIWRSDQFSKVDKRRHWSHDFSFSGNIRYRRQHIGRAAYDNEGNVTWAPLGDAKNQVKYFFTGDPNFIALTSPTHNPTSKTGTALVTSDAQQVAEPATETTSQASRILEKRVASLDPARSSSKYQRKPRFARSPSPYVSRPLKRPRPSHSEMHGRAAVDAIAPDEATIYQSAPKSLQSDTQSISKRSYAPASPQETLHETAGKARKFQSSAAVASSTSKPSSNGERDLLLRGGLQKPSKQTKGMEKKSVTLERGSPYWQEGYRQGRGTIASREETIERLEAELREQQAELERLRAEQLQVEKVRAKEL
ncbi:hypothetical protein LTR66_012186 [Elasticomyces elasticus]|nr:hypothetical protein LTR66_012186 [Elasticomyces elasticus]